LPEQTARRNDRFLPLDKGMVRMQSSITSKRIQDNGGRRRMADRRQYASSSFFPERRATRFRRSCSDRRWYPEATESVGKEKRKAFHRSQKDGAS